MTTQTIGMISGSLVAFSIIPYAVRVYQRKIFPQITSWAMWSLIGLALLVTYHGSGARDSIWPAIFGFTNPLLITILTIVRQDEQWGKIGWLEKMCAALALISLALWLYVRQQPELVQFALYVSMAADVCTGIPTFNFLWKHPEKDRPFAWVCFAFGYGLAILAIKERTFANYVLPVWMFVAGNIAAIPLIKYRLKHRIPLRDWI